MRPERAPLQPPEELTQIPLALLRLAGVEAPPEDADDRAAFEEWQVERNPWDLAGGEANHEVAPIPGRATQRWLRVAAADRVHHNVDALAAGQLLDALLEVFADVVDRG